MAIKTKTGRVRLMNRINQMVIIDPPKYMMTDIINVYEDKQGVQRGRIKPTKNEVEYDKVNQVWRLVG